MTTVIFRNRICCRWSLDEAWVAGLKEKLPELPDEKRARFRDDYGITFYDAGVLVAEQHHRRFL